MDAARQAVDGFHSSRSSGRNGGEVESIEVVWVSRGAPPDLQPEPGVRLSWRQRQGRFGLLMPIQRLAEQSGSLEMVPFYLRLAVDEPHGAPAPEAVMWFGDLPSGPY